MSEDPDLVVDYLEILHRHRRLVAEAYHRGSIDEDALGARALRDLRGQRTLVPIAHDDFRLASSLVRHLDEALNKAQFFAAVGGNIADLAGRLPLLIDEAASAFMEGRTEDLDAYVDAFNGAVFDLSDQIEESVKRLRMMADTRFGNVRTQEERQRQNAWYITRAERIGDALAALQASGLLERLEEEPAGDALLPLFRAQLWDRLAVWRASLLDITSILKAFLYKMRHVEPAGRRLRALHRYLQCHPEYVPQDVDALTEPPTWAMLVMPMRLLAHADTRDSEYAQTLIDIGSNLPVVATKTPAGAPKVGTLAEDGDRAPPPEMLQEKPFRRVMRRLLDAVPQSGSISALDWKRAQPERECADMPDAVWLHCVLYEVSLRRTKAFRFDPIARPAASRFDGNIMVRDVHVSRGLDTPMPASTYDAMAAGSLDGREDDPCPLEH